MSQMMGWVCPRCQKVHAPYVPGCECVPVSPVIPAPPPMYPASPSYPTQPWWKTQPRFDTTGQTPDYLRWQN